VIVVIGAVHASGSDGTVTPAGLAASVGIAAAAAGARVELVARIGDDPVGDAVVLAVAAAGIGHVATLRDPARPTPVESADDEPVDLDDDRAPMPDDPAGPTLDGGDVGLALRYLAEYRVIVVAHPSEAVLAEAIAAAGWAGADLVVIVDPAVDGAPPDDLPADALVLAVDGGASALGEAIGRYAAAVDGGTAPAEAFAATLGAGDVVAAEV
jgi:sugar/nucleoside kinase (ribokinase family)